MELTNELPIYGDSSLKNYNQIQTINNKTDVSSSVNIDKTQNQNQPIDNKTDASSSVNTDKIENQDHPHHHHHHRRHHHHHHHHPPHHHHHHHHRHRYHLNSPDSRSPYYSHNLNHDHHYGHHHHFQSEPFPRIITPHLPKIITPRPKIHTTTYRETGINTGNETKIMRDSSVTADFDDIPSKFL